MREGNVFSPFTPVEVGGGYPARSRWGGGYPSQVQLRYPPLDLAGGYPDLTRGYPCLGGSWVPPIRSGWGVHHLPHPPWVPPPCQTWSGGTPLRVTDGVLDTLQSVCLLRSCRRTFFLWMSLQLTYFAELIGTIVCSYLMQIFILSFKENQKIRKYVNMLSLGITASHANNDAMSLNPLHILYYLLHCTQSAWYSQPQDGSLI